MGVILENPAEGGVESVPFIEGGEDLLRADGAEADAPFDHRFKAAFELRAERLEGGRRSVGPRRPWK